MEIVCLSFGNPLEPKTWSGVPYYSTKALIEAGHTIHGVDIRPRSKLINRIVTLANKGLRMMLGRQTMATVEMFPICKKYYSHVIRKAVKQYPTADYLLIYSFSVPAHGITEKPSILFCDFTAEYAIETIQRRKRHFYEKRIVLSQDQIMQQADYIVSLFPNAADHYLEYYRRNDIRRITGYIINADLDDNINDGIISIKREKREILFVGRKNYKNGAKCLIESVRMYNNSHDNSIIKLTIIGMTKSEIDCEIDENVECIGYLDKGIPADKELFYSKILESRVIVNTTKNWGGISSLVEAMYYFTPVITSKYSDFVEVFGDDINFGFYCEAENREKLLEKIDILFSCNSTTYATLCRNAHNRVLDFTWKNNVKNLIP